MVLWSLYVASCELRRHLARDLVLINVFESFVFYWLIWKVVFLIPRSSLEAYYGLVKLKRTGGEAGT